MTLYLTIYLACWFFTAFEPLQDIIDAFFSIREPGYFVNIFWMLLGCQYCLTLWVTLAVTQNIIVALSLSALAQIHAKIIKD